MALRVKLVAGLLGGAGLIGVACWQIVGWRERQVFRESIPAQPELERLPAALRDRIADCERRLNQRPPDIAAIGELGRLYLANGYEKEAESALRAALAHDPEAAVLAHHLASLLAGYGRLDEAIEWWQRVARLKPQYSPALLKLADAYVKTNRLDEARQVYAQTMAASGTDAHAMLGLARVALAEGRWSAARNELEKAIAQDPQSSGAYSLLATVLERLGDVSGAQQARLHASSLGRPRELPDPWTEELVNDCYDPYRLQVAAATLSATGENQRAISILERALAHAPAEPRTHRQLGRLYAKIGDIDRAAASLRQTLQIDPKDALAHLDLGLILQDAGRTEEAHRALELGLQQCPDSAALHFEFGRALLSSGKLDLAAAHFEEAQRLEPDNPSAAHELVATLFRLNRKERAAEVLNSALLRAPAYAPLVLMKTRYEIEAGNERTARQFLERAAELDANPRTLEELRRQFRNAFRTAR
jgi:tetratricopeptide (TPR) repeat protein